MPLRDNDPVSDVTLTVFNPIAGTPGGPNNSYVNAPVDGRIIQLGWVPNSAAASTMTFAVAIGNQSSSTASNYTNVVTSTIGTFPTANLFAGAVASVVPASPVYVTQGDAIQFIHSGGSASSIGATCYAIIRRG